MPASCRPWAAASLLLLIAVDNRAWAAPPVSRLAAETRSGQVFLTWSEEPTPSGTTFNVYVSDRPITDVASAPRVAHHIEQHSARDWWEDPASFTKGAPAGTPVGWLISPGKPRLNPDDGLFVHTGNAGSSGRLYLAVTSSDAAGKENTEIVVGENSLREAVNLLHGDADPIWQQPGSMPGPDTGRGMALSLSLHAKGGVVKDMEYLAFGDATLGWRPGLPFKFSVRLERDGIVVRPTDRTWINRPHSEAGDGGMPAIWSFWYGYNSKIYDRQEMSSGVPTNYTERRLMWILNWIGNHHQPDPNRWYCSGSSMGGCGTISFGLRRPELFAGLHANVPIVSFTYDGPGPFSAGRLEPNCWIGHIPADLKTSDGVSLLDRNNGVKFVRETQADLPPLFMIHGRQDGSIPWVNNPPFYRALADARQAFAVYWDNGTHPTAGKDAPADVKNWQKRFRQLRRDESYPAFTHTSTDRDPGDGRADNGDLVGWINRGMDWRDIEDTADHYAITVTADYPGIVYPVSTDVTLRRLRHFNPRYGDRLSVTIGEAPPTAITPGKRGLVTIPHVVIASPKGVSLTIRRVD